MMRFKFQKTNYPNSAINSNCFYIFRAGNPIASYPMSQKLPPKIATRAKSVFVYFISLSFPICLLGYRDRGRQCVPDKFHFWYGVVYAGVVPVGEPLPTVERYSIIYIHFCFRDLTLINRGVTRENLNPPWLMLAIFRPIKFRRN